MNNANNNPSNRKLYSDELYFLLEKLGVVGNFPGSKDEKFIQLYRKSDGIYGDPTNSKSMFNLIYLLTSLGVNVYDSKNWQIIKEAIYQKEKLEELYLKKPQTGIVYESPIEQYITSKPELTPIKETILKTMNDLGFDKNHKGYFPFADCVLYLLQNEELSSLKDTLYPFLESKYKMHLQKIDYNIRRMINFRKQKEPNTEVSHYVYQGRDRIKNLECLYLVVEYIKQSNLNQKNDSKSKEIPIEEEIAKIFHQLGIYSKSKGYQYLMDSILYLLNTTESITCMEIYQYIANKHCKTSISVEKAMRQTISNSVKRFETLSKIDQKQVPDIFYYIYKDYKKPSNFKFICLILEYISENIKRNENNIPNLKLMHGNTKKKSKNK